VPHDHVFVTVEGGRAEQEELAVATLADGRYRLEVPPAMTVGLAANRVFIFTIPIAATFPVIERLFNRFVDQHPGSEWMFANVFAEDGVTPLGWWT
jgi:hypothetical protein